MKINSKEELNNYLNSLNFNDKKETKLSSVYFLVSFDEVTIPVYFSSYDGAFFESPCQLSKNQISEEELEEYVRYFYEEESFVESLKYEKTLYRDGFHYEILNFQTLPFLPSLLDNIEMISEIECLDWLIKNIA